MKHYDYVEWLFYKKNVISLDRQKKMEEHLYSCDICMEIYLSLIDEHEIEAAGEYISKDFNHKVLSKVSKTKLKKIAPIKRPFKYQFGYYVAVASVTIVLTLGGFYTNLVDAVPDISASIKTLGKYDQPNMIFCISERIVKGTSRFIGSIENIDRIKEEK